MRFKWLMIVGLAALITLTDNSILRKVRAFPLGARAEMSEREDVSATQQSVYEPWRELPVPILYGRLFRFGAYLFIGAGNRIYRSLDDGLNWELLNTGIPAGTTLISYGAVGVSIFIGTTNGVFRSDDLGQNWKEVNAGLSYQSGSSTVARTIWSLVTIGTTLFAATDSIQSQNVNAGIFRSNDLGQSWVEVTSGLPQITNSSLSVTASGSNLFAGTDRGLFRSTDLGESWVSMNFDARYVVASGSRLFTTTTNAAWRSDNQGENWTKIFEMASCPYGCPIGGISATGRYVFLTSSNQVSPSAPSNSIIRYSPVHEQSWTIGGPPNNGNPVYPYYYSFYGVSAIGETLYALRTDGRYLVNSGFGIPKLATVSASTYSPGSVAPESIAAAFGREIAVTTQSASTKPLPTELGNTTVKVKDSSGVVRFAPLLFVSPGQINYQIPAGTAPGLATVEIINANDVVALGDVLITQVAAGLFSANSNGSGEAAAFIVRVKPDDTQFREWAVIFDTAQNKYVTSPIDFGPETDRIFLILFGTGIRNLNDPKSLKVKVGGEEGLVTYYGPQGEFVGLDQLNVLLPRSLAGRGDVDVELIVNGVGANKLRINLR